MWASIDEARRRAASGQSRRLKSSASIRLGHPKPMLCCTVHTAKRSKDGGVEIGHTPLTKSRPRKHDLFCLQPLVFRGWGLGAKSTQKHTNAKH